LAGLSPQKPLGAWFRARRCVCRRKDSFELDAHAASRPQRIYRIVLCGLLIPLIAPACAPRINTLPQSVARRAPGIFHTVKPGENLFRIGKAYDLTYEELARANGIRDPRQIIVGQKIFIPGAAKQLPVEIITPSGGAATPPIAPPSDAEDGGYLWPVSGSINSGFGPRGASFHDGLDIAAPAGTPIRAVEQGDVIYSDQLRGYGNIVIIRHGGGIVSVYAHNEMNLVRDGQQVARGEVIARVGSTGRVTGPHLHFEIRKNNLAQDPMLYLPQLCCVPASDMVTPKG
jgi:murein DD-endopeptidase MepM/ murein hydrolase activator NlpD